jgi:diadenosine tetraphosphatase ApaH/serine/threonine PP2A family protein phosphatase
MFAVISDIHSNLEALTAVLDDIEKHGIETIYCLGDVVGYGPNPGECLDLIIERTKWCVLGNHDYAVFYEPTNLNEQSRKWWRFLGILPMRRSLRTRLGGRIVTFDFVHASPRRPINEYIFPDDVYTNPVKVRVLFDRVSHICFVGHTHVPGVFLNEPDFYLPDELNNVYPIVDGEKAIINIGSVGQPRDKDWRASYAYVEEDRLHFVRVEYDVDKTVEKIKAVEQLDDFHADRLKEGR